MLIKSDLRKRLQDLQRAAGIHREGRKLRQWVIYAADEMDAREKVREIEAGRVKHPDGSLFSPQESNLFLKVIELTPSGKEIAVPILFPEGDDEIPEKDDEASLIREIRELEKRRRELLKRGEK